VNGPGHRVGGIAMGLALASANGLPPGPTLVAVTASTITCAGRRWSPDIDQAKWWTRRRAAFARHRITKGLARLMGHRCITHWWGTALALTAPAALAASWALAHLPGARGQALAAAVSGLAAGWWSHLALDFAFGAAGAGRGPGIPLLPASGHIGLGLPVSGWWASGATFLVFPALDVWLAVRVMTA
jgi:hypothetical protein